MKGEEGGVFVDRLTHGCVYDGPHQRVDDVLQSKATCTVAASELRQFHSVVAFDVAVLFCKDARLKLGHAQHPFGLVDQGLCRRWFNALLHTHGSEAVEGSTVGEHRFHLGAGFIFVFAHTCHAQQGCSLENDEFSGVG